jgi:hypothetical protein
VKLVREPKTGLSKCRDCGREITLARTLPHRRVMRVDLTPSSVGTFVLEHAEGVQWATHYSRKPEYQGPLWAYHGVTCPKRPPPRPPKAPRPKATQMGLGFYVPRGNR